MRRRLAEHPIEQVGEKLRAMMPWIAQERAGGQDEELNRPAPHLAAAFSCRGAGGVMRSESAGV